MRAHVIENGVVVNTILVDELSSNMIDADIHHGSQGWVWDGQTLTDPGPKPKTRDELKSERQVAVDNIKVTTSAGHTFDGDEISQTRMARAIIALQATNTSTVTWVLADNSVIQVSAAELTEALALSGAAQAAIWVI